MDLAPSRAAALRRVAAKAVAGGRCRLDSPAARPPPAGDAADRPLDGPVPGPVRARRHGLAAGRRPRLHQAGRAARRPRPPRHGRPRWRSSSLRTSRSADRPARSRSPACPDGSPRARLCAWPPDRPAGRLHEFVPGRTCGQAPGRFVDERRDAGQRGQELARPRGQRIPRSDNRRRSGLPAPGRAPAGDRLQPRRSARPGDGTTSAPRSRRSSATRRRSSRADPGLWARLLHPDDRERALANEKVDYLGDRNTRPVEYRMRTRKGDVVWMLDEAVLEADEHGVPVWHGVLYDITERKNAERELQRALAQQAVVAKLGERALQDGDPEALLRAATTLIGEVEGVHSACIWELGRDGRRLNLRAGLEAEVIGAGRRVSAARDSHAGAALESGTHVIVPDWSRETPLHDAAGAAGLRRRQQPGGADRRQGPPLRRARRPRHRARPLRAQGRALRAGCRQRPGRCDRAPRRRPGPAPPGSARLAHRPAQPAQLRRFAGRQP